MACRPSRDQSQRYSDHQWWVLPPHPPSLVQSVLHLQRERERERESRERERAERERERERAERERETCKVTYTTFSTFRQTQNTTVVLENDIWITGVPLTQTPMGQKKVPVLVLRRTVLGERFPYLERCPRFRGVYQGHNSTPHNSSNIKLSPVITSSWHCY